MLLTSGEVGKVLGISYVHVNTLANQGHIKVFDTLSTGTRLFKPEEVERVRLLREKYPPQRGQTWNPPKD